MPFDVHRMLRLWTDPLPEDDEAAAAAFRELYSDPSPSTAPRCGQPTWSRVPGRCRQRSRTPSVRCSAWSTPAHAVALAFRLAGRHVGPLQTPAGPVPPTGQRVDVQIIDVLTLTDGRVSDIRMVADWLGALAAVGAVSVSAYPDVAAEAVPTA